LNEERRLALEQLLHSGGSHVRDFFQSAPDSSADIEDVIDDARFDAAVRLVPGLGDSRNSKYIVRIRADDGRDDEIDGGTLRSVMAGVEDEVRAAVPAAFRDQTRLALDDVTRGSVVLHYRAVTPTITAEDGQFDHGLSVVDTAIDRVTQLHEALEEAKSYAEIEKVAGSRDLLKASRELLFAMDKHALTLTTRWRNMRGERVDSTLSQRARATARDVFEKQSNRDPILLSGMVTSISLDGRILLKRSVGKGKTVEVRAEPELVTSGEFQLGQTVHLLVEEEVQKDHVGLTTEPRYTLISKQQPFDLP
jgi:hypothetical protein